jgi:hypothetical protein
MRKKFFSSIYATAIMLMLSLAANAQLSNLTITQVGNTPCNTGSVNVTVNSNDSVNFVQVWYYDTSANSYNISFANMMSLVSGTTYEELGIPLSGTGSDSIVVNDLQGNVVSQVFNYFSNYFSFTAQITSSSCNINDICMTAVNGTGVTYNISGPNFFNQTITNSCISVPSANIPTGTVNTYTVTGTDIFGCSATQIVYVINQLGMTVTNPISFLSCGQSTYTDTVYINGGIPPYTLTSSAGPITLINANNNEYSVSGLNVGTSYTLSVTSANGCTIIDTLSQPSILGLNANGVIYDNNSCNPNNNLSSGIVSVTGSSGSYNYTWINATGSGSTSNSDTSLSIPPSGATCIVSAGPGCMDTVDIIPNNIALASQIAKDTICKGDSVYLSSSIGNSGQSLPSYATSIANSSSDGEIFSVSWLGFTNSSTCATTGSPVAVNNQPASILRRYSNYTSLLTPYMPAGTPVTVSVDIGTCGGSFGNSLAIFIDFNKDGDLSDPGEKAYASTSPVIGSGTFNATINVPVNITSGKTLMRVITQEANTSSGINASGNYTWGETEDYAVDLGVPNGPWYNYSNGVQVSNGTTNMYSPDSTVTIFSLVNSNSFCNDTIFHTLTVLDSIPNVYLTTAMLQTACPLTNDGMITVVSNPVTSGLSYNWNGSNSTSNIADTLSIGSYSVMVSDSLGHCNALFQNVTSANLNCGNITGYVKRDLLQNCIVDTNDIGIQNISITIQPGNFTTFTDASGYYQFNGLAYNTYTLTHNNNLSSYQNLCGTTATLNLTSSSSILTHDFLDTAKIFVNYDVYASAFCIVPGNDSTTNHRSIYIYNNNNSFGIQATLYVKLDSFQYYTYSVPAPSSISGDTLFYIFNTPSTYQNVKIHYNIPLAALGNSMKNRFGLMNWTGIDSNVTNNHDSVINNFCASYDPNDKAVTPQGKTSNGYITKAQNELTYLIRFQNTGNLAATHVILYDTIDINKLNLNSLQVVGYSHPYEIEVLNNHVVKFKFLNIMLPDSGTNYEASQGYINFKINTKSNVLVGDQIKNKVAIYFDNNPPVITNQTLNTIYEPITAGNSFHTNNLMCAITTCGNGIAGLPTNNGVSPITYSMVPMPCSNSTFIGNTINNLAGGTYTIIATDAIGDQVSSVVTIADPTPITSNLSTTANNASVNPSGGTPPYLITWQPIGSNTTSISNLAPGNYTVTIQDNYNCAHESVFTINTPEGIMEINGHAIKVYPNPVQDELLVECTILLDQVILVNTMGQPVWTGGGASSFKIPVKGLAAGQYVLVINGVKGTKIEVK